MFSSFDDKRNISVTLSKAVSGQHAALLPARRALPAILLVLQYEIAAGNDYVLLYWNAWCNGE